MVNRDDLWPEIDYQADKDTLDALHMQAQVLGKVKVALTRTAPEWQNVPLSVNARGLTTGPLHADDTVIELAFDLVDHAIVIDAADGRREGFDLVPAPLRAFTADVMAALERLDVQVTINPMTVEVPDPVRCDVHEGYEAYEREAANRLFRVLAQNATVFADFRAGFWGKQSPVSFWWGTFDLAVNRFDLTPVPPAPGMDRIARVGADSRQTAVGFWPGNHRYPKPAYFAYTFPKPDGLESAVIAPGKAGWNADLGEFLLDFDDVRTAADPRAALMEFAVSTYEAGADLAGWDRELLERKPPL